jgi:hypothetical protein
MLSIKICGHPWYGSRSNQVHANCITGLSTPGALAVPADSLFVTNLGKTVRFGKYNATTGAALNANFATKLNYPAGIAVAPATPTPTPSPHPVAKDFSGDGFADLVWQNTSTGQRLHLVS